MTEAQILYAAAVIYGNLPTCINEFYPAREVLFQAYQAGWRFSTKGYVLARP